MRSTPLLPAAALLLASAAALPAQTTAPRDTARDADRRDTIVREYIIRRDGPGGGADGPLGDVAALIDGPRTAARRSVLGVYLGRADADGLRVAQVTPDGPAARAGIAADDRLVAVNGISLRVDRADVDDALLAAVPARRLERTVGRLAPGSEVELRVARDGRERSVRTRTVAPTDVADRGPAARAFRFGPGVSVATPDAAFGPRLREQLRGRFDSAVGDSAFTRARVRADSARVRVAARPVLGLTLESSRTGRDTLGIFVSAVATGGPAERAGVVEGDRIAALNSVDVRVPRDEQGDPRAADARRARFTRELERLRPGDRATLRVYGDGRWRTVTTTVARGGDVYREGAGFGPGVRFNFGDGVGAAAWGGVGPQVEGDVLRELRALPGPAVAPRRLRGFVAPAAPLAPVAPLGPLGPRASRRVVRI